MRALFLLLGAAVSVVGCWVQADSIGASEAVCTPGQPCICDGVGACDRTCAAAGCQVECRGIGACNVACPKGGCRIVATGLGASNLTCEGGDCSIDCNGTGGCKLSE